MPPQKTFTNGKEFCKNFVKEEQRNKKVIRNSKRADNNNNE